MKCQKTVGLGATRGLVFGVPGGNKCVCSSAIKCDLGPENKKQGLWCWHQPGSAPAAARRPGLASQGRPPLSMCVHRAASAAHCWVAGPSHTGTGQSSQGCGSVGLVEVNQNGDRRSTSTTAASFCDLMSSCRSLSF